MRSLSFVLLFASLAACSTPGPIIDLCANYGKPDGSWDCVDKLDKDYNLKCGDVKPGAIMMPLSDDAIKYYDWVAKTRK